MTVSSLAKKLIGVNSVVIESLEIENNLGEEQPIIKARPTKSNNVDVAYAVRNRRNMITEMAREDGAHSTLGTVFVCISKAKQLELSVPSTV